MGSTDDVEIRFLHPGDEFDEYRTHTLLCTKGGSWSFGREGGECISRWGPIQKDVAVVAVRRHRVVAALIGELWKKTFLSRGTWVSVRHRKRGLAMRLWARMLEETQAERVTMCVVTDRGLTMSRALQATFPKVEWDIAEDGNRRLRDLHSTAAKHFRAKRTR